MIFTMEINAGEILMIIGFMIKIMWRSLPECSHFIDANFIVSSPIIDLDGKA